MERLITREEARQHGWRCRVKYRWHLISHRYVNYELCPSPGSLWEKYTDAEAFGERLRGMTGAEDRSLPCSDIAIMTRAARARRLSCGGQDARANDKPPGWRQDRRT